MLVPILLLALLSVLAGLQFRWTGQIANAEKERLEASLRSSVDRFSRDVDEDVASILRHFRIARSEGLGRDFRDAWERYRDESAYPDLIEELYFYDSGRTLMRLEGEALTPVEWPRGLSPLRERLERRGRLQERSRWARRPVLIPVLSADPPALAFPVGAHGRRPGLAPPVYGIALLSADILQSHVFPDLAARHFGGEYDVAIVGSNPERVWYTNVSDPTSLPDTADARGTLLSLGRFSRRPPPRRGEAEERFPPGSRHTVRELGEGPWKIFVRHRSGSLETAVATARLRNLAVSFGILGILAASIVLITISTRRATELNNRKLEFVAGVSHELRTPLAVLLSAGQNLADGSVADPAQVKRYGSLIETEGRRLNDLVDRVLELAGIQSHQRELRRRSVSVRRVVDDALADCETARKERRVSIETRFPDQELMVVADPDALRRGLANLIANAIKHGGEDNVVTIVVDTRGETVRFEISDRGPGIPEEDRKHLFEAFYRGRRARDRQVPGSGLGLSLVDHVAREHGGSVELDSVPGGGSCFILSIPGARTP